MLARRLPGFQYVNNITDFPKALGNSATIAGVVRKRLRAPLELRLCLASFRGMMDFVFKPSLRLARDVTVRTLDDAAEFAQTYVGPRLPHRRDRVVHRFEEISDGPRSDQRGSHHYHRCRAAHGCSLSYPAAFAPAVAPSARAKEDETARRMFLLQYVQPGLAGLMDGSVSTLAPLFAAAFAHQ